MRRNTKSRKYYFISKLCTCAQWNRKSFTTNSNRWHWSHLPMAVSEHSNRNLFGYRWCNIVNLFSYGYINDVVQMCSHLWWKFRHL